jgi:type IV fimbrial biogenesis protein FimT
VLIPASRMIYESTKRPTQRGFTLLELIIAIAIAAILITLAVPSFTTFLNSNRVTSQANELLASLQVARMEAIRRNARVIVCASNNAETSPTPTCSAGNTWSGWVVFSDTNANAAIDAGEVIKVNALYAPTEADASGNVDNQIIFRSDGFARSAAGNLLEGTIAICVPTSTPEENARDVRIDAGSRMGVTKRNGGGSCNAPID